MAWVTTFVLVASRMPRVRRTVELSVGSWNRPTMNPSSTSRAICGRGWRVRQSISTATTFVPPTLTALGFAEPVPANIC
uniref:hypothetical protein n=1 Tax=Lentzea pudingi TaxID=1789439 RepID=UPI001E620220|nr:hypothetical protein [Lentzea pudingi]